MDDPHLSATETDTLVALARKIVDRGSRAALGALDDRPEEEFVDPFSQAGLSARLSALETRMEAASRIWSNDFNVVLFAVERLSTHSERLEAEIAAFRVRLTEAAGAAEGEDFAASASLIEATATQMKATLDRLDELVGEMAQRPQARAPAATRPHPDFRPLAQRPGRATQG